MTNDSGIPEQESPIGKELATALLAVQAGIIKNPIQKSGRNEHLKAPYFTLTDILSVLRPLFVENGLIVTTEQVQDRDNRMTIELLVLHVPSGQFVTRRKSLYLIDSAPPQPSQSIESYLRRYHYLAFFELTDSVYDDDGETAQANHPIMASEKAKEFMAKNAKYVGMSADALLAIAQTERDAVLVRDIVNNLKSKERSQEASNAV